MKLIHQHLLIVSVMKTGKSEDGNIHQSRGDIGCSASDGHHLLHLHQRGQPRLLGPGLRGGGGVPRLPLLHGDHRDRGQPHHRWGSCQG